MSGDGDRALLLSLPLPLAQAWRRSLYAHAGVEAHERALHALEAGLKYLAAAAAMRWVTKGAAGDPARRACEALVRPSLGQWQAILRSCHGALPDGDPVRRWVGTVLGSAVSMSVPGLAGRHVKSLLEGLPSYRNAMAHGAGLSAAAAEEQAPQLLAMARDMLTALVGEDAPGLWGSTGQAVVRLTGVGAVIEPNRSGRERGTVWLEDQGEPLVLSPLWVFDPDEDDVLVLNKGAGLPKVEYLSYGVSRGGTGLTVRIGPAAQRAAQFLKTATGRTDLETKDVLALVEKTEVQELAGRAGRERIGPYRIVREVAKGGQGILYEAIEEEPPRRVALKVLRQQAAIDESARRRFREEAASLARVEHPGVVPVYAVGEHEGVPWIAMKFVAGRDMAAVIESLRDRAGPMTLTACDQAAGQKTEADAPDGRRSRVEHAARIARDVARTLAACHAHGVVHRDVKPANLMLDEEGGVVLTDFGLARTVEPRSRTMTRRILGTLQYAAPEVLLPHGKQGPDARMDIYGLGATLYEMLSLRRPFADCEQDEAALLHAVLAKDPPPLRRLVPGVPRDLETIVAKAMDKDPDRRYATAGDFADDLGRYIEHQPIQARPAGRILRLRRWAVRHPALGVLVLVCAIGVPLLTGLGGYLYASWGRIVWAEQEELALAVERHLELGFLHYNERNVPEARTAFTDALERQPDSPEAVAGLALAQDTWAETLGVLERYATVETRYPQLLRIRGLALRQLGRTEPAQAVSARVPRPSSSLGFFLAALETNILEIRDPVSSRAALKHLASAILAAERPRAVYYLLRARLAGLARDTSVIDEMVEALALRWPESYQTWIARGFALSRIGRHEEALASCREATRLEAGSAVAWTNLGDALVRQHTSDHERPPSETNPPRANDAPLLERAISAYRKAIELRPDMATPMCNLGVALGEKGAFREAIRMFRAAIRKGPRLPRAHFNLGRALAAVGEHEQAIAPYEQAIALRPQEVDAYLNLGDALQRSGRGEDAIRRLEEAVEIADKPRMKAVIHHNLGFLFAARDDLNAALGAWRNAVRLDAKLTAAWRHLIDLLVYRKNTKAAIAAYRDAGGPPLLSAAHDYKLGRALYLADDFERATRAFRAALTKDPNHHWARGCMALALMERGAYREALGHLERAESGLAATRGADTFADKLARCRRLAALEPRLDVVLSRREEPVDRTEALLLAQIAYRRGYCVGAARLYREAFERAERPTECADPDTGFLAPAAAARAGCGEGKDAETLGEAARCGWRRQALDWLTADLARELKLAGGSVAVGSALEAKLRTWLASPALSGLRDGEALAARSFAERRDCLAFWARVERLLGD